MTLIGVFSPYIPIVRLKKLSFLTKQERVGDEEQLSNI
jgi:hypothetical protein